MQKRERGFTLMELMVVIVIVAILAAVAVPLYVNYVNDAKRAEAKAAIGAIISAEQAYYQVKSAYASEQYTAANNGLGNNPATGLKCDLQDAVHNWTFDVAATATGFTVTADGVVGKDTEGRKVVLTYSRTTGGVYTEEK